MAARPRWRCAGSSPPRPMRAPPPMMRRSANWFAGELDDAAPAFRAFGGRLVEALRYGENPHQSAAFYRTPEAALRRRHRPPGAGQAALLQQHQRHRRGLRMRGRVRSRAHRRGGDRQARQSVRRRRRRQPGRRLPQGAAPAIRSRRSAASSRTNRHARRRGRARHHRDLHRGDHRAGRRPRRRSRSSARRRICACCSPAACPIRAPSA